MSIFQVPPGTSLAILGHGRAGKSTVSNWFNLHTDMEYEFSTSEYAKKVVSLPGDHKDRSQYRVEWAQAIADFNAEDGGVKLYKLMHNTHTVFDGIRRVDELMRFDAWLAAGGSTLIPIWIDRDVPEDPSCEIRPEHCQLSVINRGSLDQLYENLELLWLGIASV